MAFYKSRYSGKYLLQKGGAKAKKSRRYTCLILVIVTILVCTWLLFQQNSPKIYHLPNEEVPMFAIPSTESSAVMPDSADDLVATAYRFTIETDNGTFEASCPVVHAEFGKEFNEFAISELNHLVYCIQYAAENAEKLPVTKLSYQVFCGQDILTVVLLETLDSGEQRNFVWIYDLKEDRKLSFDEMPERCLDISYTEFLWASDKYIAQRYKDYYDSVSQEEYGTDIVEQQYLRNLDFIQSDLGNMLCRAIFPDSDGHLKILFEIPVITEEDSFDVPTQTVIDPIDGLLPYINLIPSREAVREVLFDTAVSVMGADDQFHADLVRTSFGEHPQAFIAAATEDPEYAVQRLLLYASHEDELEIMDICDSLKAQGIWSTTEAAVIDYILSSIDDDV